mmetsp:Transcript_13340/g.56831  ORF Transcript_13340/g.56831 Transcript_13340/m.56831 type:complete len:221 (-) Transcript_13340:682-1344(-)
MESRTLPSNIPTRLIASRAKSTVLVSPGRTTHASSERRGRGGSLPTLARYRLSSSSSFWLANATATRASSDHDASNVSSSSEKSTPLVSMVGTNNVDAFRSSPRRPSSSSYREPPPPTREPEREAESREARLSRTRRPEDVFETSLRLGSDSPEGCAPVDSSRLKKTSSRSSPALGAAASCTNWSEDTASTTRRFVSCGLCTSSAKTCGNRGGTLTCDRG